MAYLHILNVAIIIYNLVVLLPAVWAYGFDWKLFAMVCGAVLCCAASSVGIIYAGSAS